MARHLLCLTIDTDPDGLSGPVVNRSAQTWDSMEAARQLPDVLAAAPELHGAAVPITWFIRADEQIEQLFGSSCELLERFGPFWQQVQAHGHELGWHPHLYVREPDGLYRIADPTAACEQLARVWEQLTCAGFRSALFRNGEGWHHPRTYTQVERLGLRVDSTAIPGRTGGNGHPLDWTGAPNRPYYPDPNDLRRAGPPRPLLELPMNTWHLQASYDAAPRLRYMNPAVHEELFAQALDGWHRAEAGRSVSVWVLVLHPDEIWPAAGPDRLYARSSHALAQNLARLASHLGTVEFATLSGAAQRWRWAQENPS
jgi:hypothetical protein